MNKYCYIPYLSFIFLLLVIAVIPNFFEPVIRNDPDRNIEIPEKLLHSMRTKVAYNDETIFFRFKLPTEAPSWYHDYWIYQGNGEWHRQGRSPVGREPELVYEDRITFFLDDGGVPEFGKWGGFVTISGEAMRFFSKEARGEEVTQFSRFSGQDDIRKFLPETRTDQQDWRSLKPSEELKALRKANYFLDLWHWRAHRSNPIGWSDDQYILDYRWSDSGRGPYATNWDEDAKQPAYMFSPEVAGHYAMDWEQVKQQAYAQDEYHRYALILESDQIEGNAIPFDPDYNWQVGDVLPRRLLRLPEGARGSIRANGIYRDGAWHVDMWRDLDTGSPQDDKILQHGGQYQLAFAAHILATGSRWHYVSFPLTLGLGRDADIEALRFEGEVPPWEQAQWFDLKLFYPGQIDWAHLIGRGHAGAEKIAKGQPARVGHDEETLAVYAVQSEFREEIRAQWFQTLISLIGMSLLVTTGLILATSHSKTGKGRAS